MICPAVCTTHSLCHSDILSVLPMSTYSNQKKKKKKKAMIRNMKKTYLLAFASNKDSNQSAPPRSLIRVFVVHMKKLCIHGYAKRAHEYASRSELFAGRTCLKVRLLTLKLKCVFVKHCAPNYILVPAKCQTFEGK